MSGRSPKVVVIGGAYVDMAIRCDRVPLPGQSVAGFALSYAETIGASCILIGAHSQDYSGYPDCRSGFFRVFRRVAAEGTKSAVEGKKIRILTPLLYKNKVQIISLGKRLGVPFALTWSCYRGGAYPCGRCDSCYYRKKGFAQLRLRDPALRKG